MSSSQNERILGGGGILENKQGQTRGEGVQNLAILSEHTFESPPMDGVKNKWGSNICYYIATLSLFYFFRNSQHPEK